MRFKVTGQHRKVFDTQKHIAFENAIPSDLIEKAAPQADAILSQRLRRMIDHVPPAELFKAGRDLWRRDDTVKRLVHYRALGQLAAGIFGKSILYLAFDQLLRTCAQEGFPGATPLTLQQKSCIQPLAGAALIRLSGDAHPSPLLPSKREDVVFLAPDLLIPWELFFQEPHQSFLLIAYAPAKALYVLEKNDIHTHDLKKMGYGFGDLIHPPHHPILYN